MSGASRGNVSNNAASSIIGSSNSTQVRRNILDEFNRNTTRSRARETR